MARGSIITVGLASVLIGIVFGLVITWVLWPVEFKNADLADLKPSFKEDYIRMISAAYALDGDLTAAKQRLTSLGLGNSTQFIIDLISRESKISGNSSSRDALIHLGRALGLGQFVSASPSFSPETLVVTAPTDTLATYTLVEQIQLGCSNESEIANIQVLVRNSDGHELPNIGIEIRWANGNEIIYTGLKPERGVGYADLEIEPGTYSVKIISSSSEPISNLIVGQAPVNCRTDRGKTPRGWKLVFQKNK